MSFKVEFDPEKSLKPANYSIVTPVQLLYYDDYSENSAGVVLRKGNHFSPPLDKVAFNIELPGESSHFVVKQNYGLLNEGNRGVSIFLALSWSA